MGQLLSPLTQTPYPDATDNAVGDLLEVPDAVLNLEKYANLRYTSAAARDAAIPVPVRGMRATVGTTTANSYPCWYDGGTWRGGRVDQLSQDATFPIAASLSSVEFTVSRVTVPALDYVRRVTSTGTCWVNYSATAEVDLMIYAGAGVVARTRRSATGGVGQSMTATTNAIDVASGASLVLELRVNRLSTGSVSTSVSSLLTTFGALVTPL